MGIINEIYDLSNQLCRDADMNLQIVRLIIGQNIRHWRLARRLPEEALAKHLSITLKRLHKYESGGDSPTCDELIEIAKMLRCSVDDLCLGEP